MKNMGLNSYMQNAPVVPQQQTMETTTSGQTQDPNANLPPASMNVSIQSFSFVKDNMTIAIGTTVRWTNNDTVTHTVTSDNNMFASPDLSPGQSFEYTFNTEGTFTYHCSIHPMMTGTIIVKPAIEVPTI